MKNQILEGRHVKLVPLAFTRETPPRRMAANENAIGWDQVTRSNPRSAREDRRRRDAHFVMRTTGEDKIIGYIALDGFNWDARSGWLGIGIGDANYRKNGYASEATQLMLAFAFKQLRLNRVNLNLLNCDEIVIRSYEEMGFRYEGTQREVVSTEDEHLDVIDMGILRHDWELLNRFPLNE
jgi:RimJ/RimL family protein N-acetyltransferase